MTGQSQGRAASLAFRGETHWGAAGGGGHSQKISAPGASGPRGRSGTLGEQGAFRAAVRAQGSGSPLRLLQAAGLQGCACVLGSPQLHKTEAPGRGTWRGRWGLWAGAPLPPLPAETRRGD